MRVVKRKSERGSATIEFLIMTPYFLFFFFMMVAIAVTWLGHYLVVQASTEGAAAQAVYGGGQARIAPIGNFGAGVGLTFSSHAITLPAPPSNHFAGNFIAFWTSGMGRSPWGVPFFPAPRHPASSVSIQPVWRFVP